MPMNNRILRPLARPLLLDAVPGAAAAYSLRQLSNAYTGPVVTVRRSSDNAEEDFKASEIDDGTLAAFCGAGDGFVKTWHDQSGNGNDASQATAGYQPKIVSSGSLVTENGKAALEFDGSDDVMNASSGIGGVGVSSLFAVVTPTTDSATQDGVICQYAPVASPTSQALLASIGMRSGGFFTRAIDASQNIYSGAGFDVSTTAQSMVAMLADCPNGETTFFFNGASETDANLGRSGVPTGVTIGSRPDGLYPAAAKIQEIIIYPSDQSANRERIEGDLAWSYSV